MSSPIANKTVVLAGASRGLGLEVFRGDDCCTERRDASLAYELKYDILSYLSRSLRVRSWRAPATS